MTECLLCQQGYRSSSSFLTFFLLKRKEQGLCLECRGKFEEIGTQHCPSCYKKGEEAVCGDCRNWQKQGQGVQHVSLFAYNEAMAAYFRRYKFQGDYLLRTVFAKEWKRQFLSFKQYTVVPIPLSKKRLAERGFNQVEGLLDAAEIAYCSLLHKQETEKQSSKTRAERLQLHQPFSIKEGQVLPQKVLLVDDIYTTGATLMRAKQVLQEAGVSDICTISLAR